ncbi:MAG: hypothetical protein IKU25_08530 [Clostridia bacterium]|nr:hypothetical protein [Clostridia bacterium]
MRKIKNEVVKSYKNLNPISRYAIKYGLLISFAVMAAAIYLYILFYGDVSNWRMVQLADEMVESSLGCCLATFLSALIAEAVFQKYL